MLAEKWFLEPGVIDRLLSEPYRFEFFQAVRLLETWLRQNGVAQGDVLADWLRFGNRLSLAFPASDIEALAPVGAGAMESGAALQEALRAGRLEHIHITPAFMGLLGSSGVLPLHYTQRIAAHEQEQKDTAPRAFFDMLSTQSLGFFYQAWARHRPECMVDAEGGDGFLPLLLAIAGHGGHGGHGGQDTASVSAPDDSAIADEVLAFHAARFSRRAVPACTIAGTLAEYFEVPFELEQLIGCWEDLPAADQAQVDVANVGLANGVLLGGRIYRRDTRARVRVGPLDREQFERFLPGGAAARALERMLGLFCGAGISFEVRLILDRSEVHGAKLASNSQARLGLDAFVLEGTPGAHREDIRYLLRP
jgi:type VI secretion system protein ImpH